MTTWKPVTSPAEAYRNAEIVIYKDGTWRTLTADPWKEHPQSVVYAAKTGDARVRTRDGRSKQSLAVSPRGKTYDIRGIAAGTVKAPPL